MNCYDLEEMQQLVLRMRNLVSDSRDAIAQTELTLRDRYSSDPKFLINDAFENFYRRIQYTPLTYGDEKMLIKCFPDSWFLDEQKLPVSNLHHMVCDYQTYLEKRDGIQLTLIDVCLSFDFERVCDLLKKKSTYFSSTIPHVWYHYNKNKHYQFDVIRELKFYKSTRNGLDFDLSNYYLFLETENIPITQMLVHPRVKAQVGIDININHHCPELTKFLESPLFAKLTLITECFSTDTIERIKTRTIAVATIIYNLSRWSSKRMTTTDLIVNLTSNLAICIPIETMSQLFKRIFAPSAQSGGADDIKKLLKAFFLCLFVLVVGKLPGKHTIDEFINRVHKFPQAFDSVQKFWKQIDPITQYATNYIESELLGYDIIEEKTIMDEVQNWANLVEEYSDLYKKREIAKDKNTMLTAGRIHVDGVRLLSKCMRLHYSRENVDLIRSLLPTTYKISEIAIRSGADHSKPRREPLIVWFCGKSGVGKSTLTYPFLCDMMKSELGPSEELPDNWVQKIYARAPECEYFDGDPTDWMVYDDGFQIRDSVANPSPELFEIIRLGNMFPYMYHKASIEEKGNCFADVKGIVISSNIERIMAESIHCPEAVARRIRYAYKVQLKTEFRQYYIGKDGKQTYKLDKTKISGPDMNIYRFQPFDPLSGDNIGHPLSYQDMLLQCALALRQLGDEFISYEKWLEDYRKKPFVAATAQAGDVTEEERIKKKKNLLKKQKMRYMSGKEKEKEWMRRMDMIEFDQKRLGEAIELLKNGKCLGNNHLLVLQWFFGSSRRMESFESLGLKDYNLEHLRRIFENPPVEIYAGPKYDERVVDQFYEELYDNRFLNSIKQIDGKTVNRVIIDKSCEYIPPFNGFSVAHVINKWLVSKYNKQPTLDLRSSIAQSWKQDYYCLRKDPFRSITSAMKQSVCDLVSVPYVVHMLGQIYLKKDIIPETVMTKKYLREMENMANARVRCSEADYIFRTQLPYVQAGVVIEEISETDTSNVKKQIQLYRMRIKKIAKDAWAYTCANWPNMLLYTVGFVSATYSLYNLVKESTEEFLEQEEEKEVAPCEAQSLDESGSRTQPRPRARVQHEDTSSGKQNYKIRKPIIQNLDVSGPSNQKRNNHARVQAEVELRPDWTKPRAQGNTSSAVDHQLYSVLDSRVYANTLMAYITPRNEDTVQRRLGHIVALRGSLFMMNYHFVLVLREYGEYDVVIRQGNNVYYRCSTRELVENYVRVNKRDLVIFEMKRKGIAFGDLVKHIQTKSMSYSHNVQTVVLARQRLSGMCVSPNMLTSVDGYLSTSPISIDLDMRGEVIEVLNAESWLYTGVTNNGDCGALLLISNNRVPSKIVGVHNAFDPYKCKAIAVPLYREEVEETMAYFRPRLQYGWHDDFPIKVSALEFDQGENFNVVRCEEGSIPSNSKTRLAKSPIFEHLSPTLTKPGYLRPFKNENGEVVDPAKLARAKWGYHLPKQDKAISERVTNAVVQVFMKKHREGNERYEYPLTTEEAILGVEGVEGLNSINKVSSPGYPYVFDKIPGRGKTGYFGQFEFDLTLPGAQQVIREVEVMERDILNNKRPFVVWIDTLKDARIPIAKAEKGKTRIFSAGPMAYTILYRKYFLPPIAHVMWNRIDNHIAVGINPTSPEWHSLALKLKSKGTKCVAGDYACFDGKAPTEGYEASLRFFQAWYEEHWDRVIENNCNIIDGYEMSRFEFMEFLEKIFLEVINHIHLMEYEIDGVKQHLFYSVCNGQPSGNPGTALTNSGEGLYMMIRCWLELTKGTVYCTIDAFFKHVYMVDYGDDVALNISDEAIIFFNQNTLTKVMKRLFDIDFTDEKKTGDVIPDYRSLSEISFLKRGFVFSEEIQMYVCPMEVDILLDILNWVRTGTEDPRIITINNIESVVAELALVSQEAFDEWVPQLKKKYAELAWRVNKNIYFDTRFGYLLAYRNAQFKAVEMT